MAVLPHPSLLVHSSVSEADTRAACARGELVRLVPGRYVRLEHWKVFTARERYLVLSLAVVSGMSCDAVLSHASAAAFWGFSWLGPWPSRVHVTVPAATTSTANRWSYKHASPVSEEEITSVDGVRVTRPLRTAVDLARSQTFRRAVVALDHGLHHGLFDHAELVDAHGRVVTRHGGARALRAIEFADGRADKPGESLSRVVMHENGFEPPELQRRFRNDAGPDAYVDFSWRRCGRLGEFDGEVKYRDERLRAGRSPEQVVIDEKNRENWLLQQPGVERIVRWDWRTVVRPGTLAALLTRAGVPRS